jgi:ubiquinone/menaquinone biosynthesis C-methylase UbiE
MAAKKTTPLTTGQTISWARYYDAVVAVMTLGRARSMRRLTVDLARISSGESVLDVGCGTGDLTMLLRERVGTTGRVVGIDAAPEMITVAQRKSRRSRLKPEYLVAAVEDLPFGDGTFDAAVSSLMLHHLPDELKPQALHEVSRVLKPGGRLLIVDLTHTHAHGRSLSLPMLLHRRAHGRAHAPARRTPDTHTPTHRPSMAALLHSAEFTDIESGGTRFHFLEYARARKKA